MFNCSDYFHVSGCWSNTSQDRFSGVVLLWRHVAFPLELKIVFSFSLLLFFLPKPNFPHRCFFFNKCFSRDQFLLLGWSRVLKNVFLVSSQHVNYCFVRAFSFLQYSENNKKIFTEPVRVAVKNGLWKMTIYIQSTFNSSSVSRIKNRWKIYDSDAVVGDISYLGCASLWKGWSRPMPPQLPLPIDTKQFLSP